MVFPNTCTSRSILVCQILFRFSILVFRFFFFFFFFFFFCFRFFLYLRLGQTASSEYKLAYIHFELNSDISESEYQNNISGYKEINTRMSNAILFFVFRKTKDKKRKQTYFYLLKIPINKPGDLVNITDPDQLYNVASYPELHFLF